jgi:hypothetical protein
MKKVFDWIFILLIASLGLFYFILLIGYHETKQGEGAAKELSRLTKLKPEIFLDSHYRRHKGLRGGSAYYRFSSNPELNARIVESLGLKRAERKLSPKAGNVPDWIEELSDYNKGVVYYSDIPCNVELWFLPQRNITIIRDTSGL